ncbi:3-hydroxyacyl-CoA dehydrogenase family protein [Thermodesulforhabdus norvegica]|uniref:L-gulonate 3-dehydrogenase n=1 Tax=Thermodesulforhabdus norvegica TaxID=39841 RepID=A0A1I4R262_9BACT|nr:3-hydroxyacyl-CoA dehydrogenase NAD-binding domain-containing protein [Thermodesulforhabdus norvegica]SFM46412.1 3-hydroxypropionate dehydrogenase (NADP+) [Thermodesulforhabdus norvegica]
MGTDSLYTGHVEVRKVACIGSGFIGQGWAVVFALRGLPVAAYDIGETVLSEAQRRIRKHLNLLRDHGLVTSDEVDEALGRIEFTTVMERALEGADYVQESVPDRLQIKRKVFQDLDGMTDRAVILASSSSGFRMTDIQKGLRHPERCVLVHPFLPVHIIPVVEVVGGELTSPEVVERVCEFMKRVGKVPIRLKKEVPGYILNRFQAAVLREAVDLVGRGVASVEDIDRAFRLGLGIRDPFMGPFMRASMAGGDIEGFFEHFSSSYRSRWEDMATWTEIPEEAKEKVVEEVSLLETAFGTDLEARELWRDRMIVEMIKFLNSFEVKE